VRSSTIDIRHWQEGERQINERYDLCRERYFGSDTWYLGKRVPNTYQTALSIYAGRSDPRFSAMVLAIWSKESGLDVWPGGDAGPAQLTTWWKRNQPELIQGNAYGSWNGRTDKPFDGSVSDNVATLGNIVYFLHGHHNVGRNGDWGQIPYWYGPPADRKAYSADVMSRYQKYLDFLNCLAGKD
jgi:hypothetical protein